MHELLAPCAFLSGAAVMTKRQDVFQVLRVEGLDPECLEPADIARICQRFEAALRVLDSAYRVYQYVMKRKAAVAAPGQERTEWLASRDLYSIELHFVILRMRPVMETAARSLMTRFSTRATLAVGMRDIRREVELLQTAVASVSVQLQDTIHPRVLDRKQTLGFLRGLLNYGAPPATGAVQEYHVDQQIATSGVECWKTYLTQGQRYIKVLSLTEIPAQTFAYMLRQLLLLPCEFVFCTEWRRENNHTVRRYIDAKRRHYHFAKTSIMSYVGSSNPRPDEVLIDDSKTAVVDELNQALRQMEVEENHFGRFSFTIALHDADLAVLRHCSAKAVEVFATHDAKIVEETYNSLNAWLAMMPGNYAQNLRQLWLLNTNYADMSFLFRPAEGGGRNEHLDAPSLNVLETREATPYNLNLHVQDVGHTFVLGSTGSGKSFLLNFLTDSYQQYAPHSFIFDLGGSYRALTAHHRGSYLHVGKESGFTINPFRLRHTVENLDFLFAFVSVLIERGGYSMPVEERKDLHRAIGDLYQLGEADRRLSTLATTCGPSYKGRLAEWVGQGRLAGYFDHAEDTLTLARFQTFDFEGMDRPEVLEPLLFYVLHRANAVIQHSPGPKLFVFDEAWKFFRNPITRAYIHEALKTWRKRNTVMLLATQSSDDLLRSELLPVILESCMTQMFLASPGMDTASYRATFGLNATEADLIARLTAKRELLLRQGGRSKVLNLNVDPPSARIYGNQL